MAVALSLSLAAVPAQGADVFVGTPPFNPDPGEQFEIELFVDVGAGTLGAYVFDFLYDPAVVAVVAVDGGATPAFGAPPVSDPTSFSSGVTPLAAVQGLVTAPTGFLSVAALTLEAVGSPGASSVLDLSVSALLSGEGAALAADVFAANVLIAPVCDPFFDADGDGVGDACDNCVETANSGQEDAGGVGPTSPPDGIGNACQCGDVNDDGFVTGLDGTLITRAALNLAPFPNGVSDLAAPDKCDVGGTAGCSGLDGTLVKRASLGLAPGVEQNCAAATGAP